METTLKEKSLQHQAEGLTTGAAAATASTAALSPEELERERAFNELDGRVVAALRAANDRKAINITVLDVREVSSFTEYFVITSGTNTRQVQAISDAVQETLKKQQGARVSRVEGYNTAEWILLDYGDFVMHVFEDKARKFYDLERLWRDGKKIVLPAEFHDPFAGITAQETIVE